MKSFTTNLMVAAAALVVVAGSASAQSLKAEIPFAFNAAGARMAPGTYRILVQHNSGGTNLVQLFNADTQSSVIAMGNPGADAPKAWIAAEKAMLSFACVDGHCDLRTVWMGESVRTLTLPAPKHGSHLAGVEVVNIRAAKAD